MENTTATAPQTTASATVLNQQELLSHWQGHRQLTRRVIEAFPEHDLFHYSIGGMRTFAQLVQEINGMAAPAIRGIVTGKWVTMDEIFGAPAPQTRAEILKQWDETTEELNKLVPLIPEERFYENEKVFGVYEGLVNSSIQYFIDNEIHHRGQGYVYLRSLGITPPPFWER
jgi:uncharacterized damage-inducible protein DinB